MGNLTLFLLDTPGKKAQGLQNMSPVPPKTLWIFTRIYEGTVFHSRNVKEPFDIAFLDKEGNVLEKETIVPEERTISAPRGTEIAVESKGSEMERIGIQVGSKVNLVALLGQKGESGGL